MKHILLAIFTMIAVAVRGQMKGDTTHYWYTERDTTASQNRFEDELFHNIVLLMQQNKELSDRLDRAEKRIDSLERRPMLYFDHLSPAAPSIWAKDRIEGWDIKLLDLRP